MGGFFFFLSLGVMGTTNNSHPVPEVRNANFDDVQKTTRWS